MIIIKAICLPFYLPFWLISSNYFIVIKILGVIANLLIILPAWLVIYLMIGYASFLTYQTASDQLGIAPENVYVSGTGSMYPTFPKGQGDNEVQLAKQVVAGAKMYRFPGGIKLLDKRYFDYKLKRSDIVTFFNQKTAEISAKTSGKQAGFIKRVIGLPSDTVEIRNGYVFLNGERLDEPYTASPRSTFGGNFLSDCQKITIPDNHIFVLGDNRKGSDDSRFDLGLVSFDDIERVLPFAEQKQYEDLWRDTSKDADISTLPILDTKLFLYQINKKRLEAGLAALKYQPKLEQSAASRAQTMLKFNDLSFEATRSGYTMQKALKNVGYSNIVLGEAPTQGYYTADELIDNYFHFPSTRQFILNKDYQEVGVSVSLGVINGCPTQIVVAHFGGYKPATYKPEEIEGWKTLLNRLKDIQPGWQEVRKTSEFYNQHKSDIDEINSIIERRMSNIQSLITTMEARRWLTDEQLQQAKGDQQLYVKQQQLAQKLNNPS